MNKLARASAKGLLAVLALTGAAAGDPGLLLELDSGRFELTARDLRAGVAGPSVRVVLGSPHNPTPRGVFPLYRVYRNPAWAPAELAREAGANRLPPSPEGPMGAAKIPFAGGGFALHGGADPKLLGKPVSLGCVRIADEDLLGILAWLEARGAIGPQRPAGDAAGQLRQDFLRRARLVVR
jgi:hypothetical protein